MKLLRSIWKYFFPIAKEIVLDTVGKVLRKKRVKIWQNRSFRKQQLIGKIIDGWRIAKFISAKKTKKTLSKKARNSFTYKLESWQRVRISA